MCRHSLTAPVSNNPLTGVRIDIPDEPVLREPLAEGGIGLHVGLEQHFEAAIVIIERRNAVDGHAAERMLEPRGQREVIVGRHFPGGDALNAQMTELLLNAFPKTTVVLDPASQMTTQLEHLRVAAGEMSPDDYLSLAARLEHSLGGVPVNGIAALDYHDRRLDVTFKPDVKPDAAFGQRLAQNGLAGDIDTNTTGKWVIRNGSAQ